MQEVNFDIEKQMNFWLRRGAPLQVTLSPIDSQNGSVSLCKQWFVQAWEKPLQATVCISIEHALAREENIKRMASLPLVS